jgi:hypothetical protein
MQRIAVARTEMTALRFGRGTYSVGVSILPPSWGSQHVDMAKVEGQLRKRDKAAGSGAAAEPARSGPAAPAGRVSSQILIAAPSSVARAADGTDPNRVGIVFVHGIGTQAACETFLDWSGSIVRVLSDWRVEHGFGIDPVVRCEYDLSGSRLPILEVEVPEYDGHSAQRWVMTEAWWAGRTRVPNLSYMTTYVFHAMGPIMAAIRQSYAIRRASWAKQAGAALDYAGQPNGYQHSKLVLGQVRRRSTDWIDLLDRVQKELTILAFGPALILGRIAIWLYAPFRAIPIAALRDAATLKSIDNFLTRWFGELPDITRDPVQSANVRSRLAAAIRGLRNEGCGRMVVIAHSGGAVVGFETLCDPFFADLEVHKLVTLGEGLALAWRIENAAKELPAGSRLRGDLTAVRPQLQWSDFWSTYDPAPAGPLNPPPEVRLADRTNSAINRMSLLEDHGSYWDNDEEFMIPLLQDIDESSGQPSESRFFRDGSLATVRLAWRRQRVAVLALWRWLATLGAAVPIAVGTIRAILGATGALGLSPKPGPERLGADITAAWSHIPGHELIAGPLDGISKVAGWPGSLPLIGEWIAASAAISVAFLVLARIGVGRWEAWDLRARVAARKRVPQRVSPWRPRLTFGFFTAVDVAMAVATLWLFWR